MKASRTALNLRRHHWERQEEVVHAVEHLAIDWDSLPPGTLRLLAGDVEGARTMPFDDQILVVWRDGKIAMTMLDVTPKRLIEAVRAATQAAAG